MTLKKNLFIYVVLLTVISIIWVFVALLYLDIAVISGAGVLGLICGVSATLTSSHLNGWTRLIRSVFIVTIFVNYCYLVTGSTLSLVCAILNRSYAFNICLNDKLDPGVMTISFVTTFGVAIGSLMLYWHTAKST